MTEDRLRTRAQRLIENPRYAYNQFALYVNKKAHNLLGEMGNQSMAFDADWDNLIILDGCRYDLITQHDFDNASVGYRISEASHTTEFVKKNIKKSLLDDVVWVSANPQLAKFTDSIYKVIRAWESHWDQEDNTVHPDDLAELALNISNSYENK
ncbi:MAG: hypothetical protein ABEI13_03395, partial [Candidatus Paceibacteria bacterium]